MLQFSGLSHTYSSEKKISFPDQKIEQGVHTLILAPSGGGKTTLLHILSGLLRPTQGNVLFEGKDITEFSNKALDLFRGTHFGLIFQQPHLIKSLSVVENLRAASFFGKTKRNEEFFEKLLQDLGISDLLHRKVFEISQGQAQRVAIARAVVNDPKIIFCDEPTASLDDDSCTLVVDLLKKQAERCKATLIIATHDQRVKSEFSNHIQL